MKQKSNKKMMILSCIGIIIVVLGHTGNTLKLASDIFPYYSFHMEKKLEYIHILLDRGQRDINIY